MTFYGFSKFFPVVRVTFCDMGISLVQQIMLYKWEIIFHIFIVFAAKSCPDPGRPRNGDAKGLFVFGEKVYYTCDQCYKLKGPGYRQCQADQEWTDTQPTCERKYFECILRYDDFCIYWYRRNQTQFRNITNSNRLDHVAQLAEHWTSLPKVADSIPTVVKQTFQLARCGCTLRVTSQTSYSLEYITPTHTKINIWRY